jgi:hypothetical protein
LTRAFDGRHGSMKPEGQRAIMRSCDASLMPREVQNSAGNNDRCHDQAIATGGRTAETATPSARL